MNLPQLPQPPTDNLYKFIAVIGLGIYLTSLVAPFYLIYTAYTASQAVDAKISQANAELINTISNLEHEIASTPPDQPIREEYFKESLAKGNAFRLKTAEIQSDLNRVKADYQIKIGISLLLAIVQVVAGIIMWQGFSKWYKKLQIYQDIIVKNQAEEKAPKTNTTPKRKSRKRNE